MRLVSLIAGMFSRPQQMIPGFDHHVVAEADCSTFLQSNPGALRMEDALKLDWPGADPLQRLAAQSHLARFKAEHPGVEVYLTPARR